MRLLRRHYNDNDKDNEKDNSKDKYYEKYIQKNDPRDLRLLTYDESDEETWRWQWQRQTQWQIHSENTLWTMTFDLSEETWPDQQKDNDTHKYNKKTKTMTMEEHLLQRKILETCDLWDTDYISDNWEQQTQHSHWPLNKEW